MFQYYQPTRIHFGAGISWGTSVSVMVHAL